MNDYAKRTLADWGLKSETDLIPCGDELNRLKEFLACHPKLSLGRERALNELRDFYEAQRANYADELNARIKAESGPFPRG